MPKVDIDYSNTIIYKIYCKDDTVTDIYVGHTTNFVQRKSAHKQGCTNVKHSNYSCKLYNTIREHGGWSNWNMDIIAFYNCNDQSEARQKEQEHFVSLNATLNSIEPYHIPKDIPILRIKPDAIKQKFCCENCSFGCSKYSDYIRHISTRKHLHLSISKHTVLDSHTIYRCLCGLEYKYSSGLYRHKRVCQLLNDSDHNTETPYTESAQPVDSKLLIKILKQNQELKYLMEQQIHNNKLLCTTFSRCDKEEDQTFEKKITNNVFNEVLLDKA